jgi:hypothetical protein
MGGYGSGRWYRYGTKTTVEQVKRLDIRRVKFPPSSSGTISWPRNGGSVGFEVSEHHVLLRYSHRIGNGPWQEMNETISFDRTPCHYGGVRVWLLCPDCGTRVAVLYLAGARFLCRHCYRLPYSSQQETNMDRMFRKAQRVRGRLGAKAGLTRRIWDKPRGMHWKTFERLIASERIASAQAYIAWGSYARRALELERRTDDGRKKCRKSASV